MTDEYVDEGAEVKEERQASLLDLIREAGGISSLDPREVGLAPASLGSLPVVEPGKPAVDVVVNLHGSEINIPDLLHPDTGEAISVPGNSGGKVTVVSLVSLLGGGDEAISRINASYQRGGLRICLDNGWLRPVSDDAEIAKASKEAYIHRDARERALEIMGGNPEAVGDTGIVLDAATFLEGHPEIEKGDPYMKQLIRVASLYDIDLEATHTLAVGLGTRRWKAYAGGQDVDTTKLDEKRLHKKLSREQLLRLAEALGIQDPTSILDAGGKKALAALVVDQLKKRA